MRASSSVSSPTMTAIHAPLRQRAAMTIVQGLGRPDSAPARSLAGSRPVKVVLRVEGPSDRHVSSPLIAAVDRSWRMPEEERPAAVSAAAISANSSGASGWLRRSSAQSAACSAVKDASRP